jgi:vancomycin aglycone glucosyltransferase
MVATGLFSSVCAARSVAEKQGIRYVFGAYCPIFLPSAYQKPPELLAFLDAGAPPVYMGFGSLPAPKDFAHMAIDVVRAQGRRALISRGWAELALVDDREDCFIIGEVNQQAVFPRVAAVVHHGGAGTTTVAARAGSPQVVVPQIVDQPYWASRVWDLGVGSAHAGSTPTAESLSAALESALNRGTRERALAVADTIIGDGAMRAARLLIEAT